MTTTRNIYGKENKHSDAEKVVAIHHLSSVTNITRLQEVLDMITYLNLQPVKPLPIWGFLKHDTKWQNDTNL